MRFLTVFVIDTINVMLCGMDRTILLTTGWDWIWLATLVSLKSLPQPDLTTSMRECSTILSNENCPSLDSKLLCGRASPKVTLMVYRTLGLDLRSDHVHAGCSHSAPVRLSIYFKMSHHTHYVMTGIRWRACTGGLWLDKSLLTRVQVFVVKIFSAIYSWTVVMSIILCSEASRSVSVLAAVQGCSRVSYRETYSPLLSYV